MVAGRRRADQSLLGDVDPTRRFSRHPRAHLAPPPRRRAAAAAGHAAHRGDDQLRPAPLRGVRPGHHRQQRGRFRVGRRAVRALPVEHVPAPGRRPALVSLWISAGAVLPALRGAVRILGRLDAPQHHAGEFRLDGPAGVDALPDRLAHRLPAGEDGALVTRVGGARAGVRGHRAHRAGEGAGARHRRHDGGARAGSRRPPARGGDDGSDALLPAHRPTHPRRRGLDPAARGSLAVRAGRAHRARALRDPRHAGGALRHGAGRDGARRLHRVGARRRRSGGDRRRRAPDVRLDRGGRGQDHAHARRRGRAGAAARPSGHAGLALLHRAVHAAGARRRGRGGGAAQGAVAASSRKPASRASSSS